MASLLNNASLLLNPAGSIISYQEDKIYSVLPKDGTGDFTFSGGDGGTRVNQQGYIEQTPANLMTYSEEVSSWTGNLFNNWIQSAVTSNIVTAPNGTLTADRLGDGYGRFNVSATAIPSQTYTYSVYLKNVSLTNSFDIVYAWGLNGTLVSYGTATSVNVSTLSTTGWTRITATITAPSSGINQMQFGPCPFTGYGNPSGQQIDVWGGMINIGSTALPYQPTTDRLNYPRITYQNGRGALLQEPARTNLCTYSEDLTNGVWSKTNVSITSNDTISPDGTQNADRVIRNGTSSTYFNNTNTLSSSNRANSMFFKKGTIDQVTLLGNSYSSGTYATFNLSNGTIINSAGCTPFVEQYRDGWYRCGFVQTNGVNYYLLVTLNGYNNDTVASGEYLYAWGGQTELGEFASTYIPTTSATVTRPLDEFFKNDSPALNTTSWTFYMSGVNIGKNQNASNNNIDNVNWSFDSGAGPYGPNSIHNYNNTVYYYDTVNGAANLGSIGNTTTKFAVTKNGTTFKLFRDGVLFSTNTLSLASNVWDSFRMYGLTDAQGQAFLNNPSTVAILPSALSDADAQSLTTVRSGSGGTISYYGPYTIHTFTGSATFTPSFTGPVEVLVVAGGGGTGYDVGGGGGGGGVIYASSYGVTAGSGITVTIGAGGTSGQTPSVAGGNGGNSVFGGLTALGGGGGGTYPSGQVNGLDGGSGGGGGNYNAAGGSGSIGQGYNGGSSSATWGSGGGGGAAGNGANAIQNQTVPGGLGATYSISGFSTTYSGGGYGAYDSQTDLPTGQSASGVFLGYYGYGANGTGYPNNSPYTGNPGIVIVRYLT